MSKCDELKRETRDVDYGLGPIPVSFYDADKVDAAITELKAEIAQWKDKCHGIDNSWNEQTKEIAELKTKLEDAKATAYAESADAGMENRRLKRALWLARQWRAWCEGQFWFALEIDRLRDIYHLILTKRIHRTPNEWVTYWQKVEQLCEKKAEEYK